MMDYETLYSQKYAYDSTLHNDVEIYTNGIYHIGVRENPYGGLEQHLKVPVTLTNNEKKQPLQTIIPFEEFVTEWLRGRK